MCIRCSYSNKRLNCCIAYIGVLNYIHKLVLTECILWLAYRNTRLGIYERKSGETCIFVWCWWSLGSTSNVWRGVNGFQVLHINMYMKGFIVFLKESKEYCAKYVQCLQGKRMCLYLGIHAQPWPLKYCLSPSSPTRPLGKSSGTPHCFKFMLKLSLIFETILDPSNFKSGLNIL